jgi:hypothetical protein
MNKILCTRLPQDIVALIGEFTGTKRKWVVNNFKICLTSIKYSTRFKTHLDFIIYWQKKGHRRLVEIFNNSESLYKDLLNRGRYRIKIFTKSLMYSKCTNCFNRCDYIFYRPHTFELWEFMSVMDSGCASCFIKKNPSVASVAISHYDPMLE